MPVEQQERWSLTRRALERLLRRLDEQPEAAAREYEFLRRRLITFFSVRRADSPEALADETFDRVARRLEQGETIQHVRAYFYGVAQRVALEWDKRQAQARDTLAAHVPLRGDDLDPERREARIGCLEACLAALPRDERAVIQRYYHTGALSHREGRKRLARRLGIGSPNLKMRVHRIRGRLETCLRECLESRRKEGQP